MPRYSMRYRRFYERESRLLLYREPVNIRMINGRYGRDYEIYPYKL